MPKDQKGITAAPSAANAIRALNSLDLAERIAQDDAPEDRQVSAPASQAGDDPDRVAGETTGDSQNDVSTASEADAPKGGDVQPPSEPPQPASDEGAAEEPPPSDADEASPSGEADDAAPPDEESEAVAKVPGLTDAQKQHYTKMLKERVAKEKDKRASAESKAEQLEAEREQLRQELEQVKAEKAITPTAQNPVANVVDPRKLEEAESSARVLAEWTDDLLARLPVDPDGVLDEMKANGLEVADGNHATAAKLLTDRRRQSRAVLNAAPQQRDYLARRAEYDRAVALEFKWWKDKTSQERQIADGILKGAQRYGVHEPDTAWVAAHAARSIKWSLDAMAKAQAKPATPPRPAATNAPTPPTRRSAPASLPGQPPPRTAPQAVKNRFEKTPDSASLAELIGSTI